MILTRVAHPQYSVFRGFNERSDRGGKGRLRGIAGTVLALRISPARMKGETHRFWEYAVLSGNSHADRRSELGDLSLLISKHSMTEPLPTLLNAESRGLHG